MEKSGISGLHFLFLLLDVDFEYMEMLLDLSSMGLLTALKSPMIML